MPRVIILSNPRSGSNYLRALLNCHPDIHIAEELLNDEVDIDGDPITHLEKELSRYPLGIIGFKVFPEQIFERGLSLDSLVREIGATHVIVLWREGILETLVSRRIADKTGIWYSNDCPTSVEKIQIDTDDLTEYSKTTVEDWCKIGSQWPAGVHPIFVKFEDLTSNPMAQIRYVLSKLTPPSDNFVYNSPSKRQNPAKLAEKVTNFYDIADELRDAKLNVREILETKIPKSIQLPLENMPFAPDSEPCMPPEGWRYRVAEPFMPSNVKQNVYDAVESGSVSSAGFWPRLMSSKLKELFQVPVAQPCSNGFTALMLAMQSANISQGDEVIMPSMTMVAVPNAAHFLGATPVFADCSEGNYNPSWEEFQKVSSCKTKALIVTHTYGVPTQDMERITEECKKRGWWLIEDISECVGVKTKAINGQDQLLGTFGHFAIASMYVNKMIHAGDGGFVLAKDPKLAIRLTSLVNHGFTPSYHFVHYERALNAKINGLGAAMACGCIDEIKFIMDHRAQVCQMYRQALANLPIKLMPICGPLDTPWVFGLECKTKNQRTELRAFLAKFGIETRDYFFALHLQPAYYTKSDGVNQPRLPNSEKLGSTGFYLPTHSNLKQTDIDYITSCIKQFFHQVEFPNSSALNPKINENLALQINPGSFQISIRKFNESGSLSQVEFRGHVYIEAVKIGLEAEALIIHERWDTKMHLIEQIKNCIESSKGLKMHENMKKYFEPYLNYFESQVAYEQSPVNPWHLVDLNSKIYEEAQDIPTTTDTETLQLLLWLIQETKPEIIWEIGCWMGHASYRMASLGQSLGIRQKVFACDAFRWQDWMATYLKPEMVLQPRQSFKKHFQHFTDKVSKSIEAVDWPYDISELPIMLVNQRPNLIFLDMTQEDEELETIWQMILPNLIPNETIILFNGLSHKSILFFTRHADVLGGIAKPNTIAKAFRFIQKSNISSLSNRNQDVKFARLPRKLNFQSDPEWSHHHKNLFCSSVALLKDQFHDENAPILFFPAVEEKICDVPDLFLSNPWIGIAHSVAEYPELFYTPDLKQLCSPKYRKIMNNCKGLFTLTEFQTKYFNENLPKDMPKFPIQPIKYPVEWDEESNNKDSTVPETWKSGAQIDLVFIGSFARDFELFFETKVPINIRKVLVASDDISKNAANNCPDSSEITILGRITSDEYEALLMKSIVFLSLKYDGAANTIILECITRNVPIVSPRLTSCTEYLGTDYPLLYDPKSPNIEELLTVENIQRAISYLKAKDKSPFSVTTFFDHFGKGAVLGSVPPMPEINNFLTPGIVTQFAKYDVTICICSYKRTHHLSKILKSFWESQDFQGSFQIIVWNNNEGRTGVVRRICKDFVKQSDSKKSLEIINSTQNYFCSVRFAVPALMKSDCLLICDDDVIPGSNFVSFFTSAHLKNPKDVLCVRGHVFLPHKLNVQDPSRFWVDYESLRFKNDDAPEQLIHFVHADACLIPKGALREIASTEMPDPTFNLVDDYWMSFILNHRFGRKLRKLCVAGLSENPIHRTEDSDQAGLALHTRSEVQDARTRLYIHHMAQSWPVWSQMQPLSLNPINNSDLKTKKSQFWNTPQLGYNISSNINPTDLNDLIKIGTKSVRIGAVGIGGNTEFDLCGFLTNAEDQLAQLTETVDLLTDNGIDVILTLERRLASHEIWKLIASKFASYSNVVGYDLINEPFTEAENDMHWTDFEEKNDSEGLSQLLNNYTLLIKSIREIDQVTPIIIESSYWGRIYSLSKLPISELKKIDSNLITSFHFYEPMLLTTRQRNKGRYTFPGPVSKYDNIKFKDQITWNEDYILQIFQEAKSWADQNDVRIFLGEFGIGRNIGGAEGYLKAIINSCKDVGISGYVFSFRDADWEAMDYELGSDMFTLMEHGNWNGNGLIAVILEGFKTFKERP